MMTRRILPLERRMRNRLTKFYIALGTVILVSVVSCALLANKTESERVEARTLWAVEKLRLLRTGQARSSPKLMLELSFSRSRDPEGDANREFFAGMDRLEALGALEKRMFALADTNAVAGAMTKLSTEMPKIGLWDAHGEANSLIVRAKDSEMGRIETLIQANP
jgi:hypothetical protein